MKIFHQSSLIAPFIVSTIMTAVAEVYSRKYRDPVFIRLKKLWFGLTIVGLCSFLLGFLDVRFYPLVFLTWLYPLKLLKENLDRSDLIILGSGVFSSFVGLSFQYNDVASSLPFIAAYAYVGLRDYLPFKEKLLGETFLERFSDYAVVGFFISRIFFLWRTDLYVLAFVDFITFVFLAMSLIPNAFEEILQHGKRELEELVKQRNEKLVGQSKYAELGLMSAGIAHEINNPLAVIQAKTTQLLRIYRDPHKIKELGEGLEQILFTSERINRTIQGVREFVHQDENAQYAEISLQELISSVLSFCGQRLKNHGINLRFYGLEDYTIVGNKIQLEQVLLNLINNSFDAIEFLSDKWIELSVEQQGDRLRLFFKDSGKGIPDDIADKIMEPFFSTKALDKGTGMGLALARGIAEQHGGRLSYVKGTGHTTFLLELPLNIHRDLNGREEISLH